MATITIAPCEHLEALIAIEQAASDYPWSVNAWSSSSGANYYLFAAYLAEQTRAKANDEAEPVGFYLAHVVSDQCTLMNIAVHPKAQRCGVARQLIDHLLNLARAKHCQQLWLEVRASNRPAQALYEQFNFKPVSVRKNYYSCAHQAVEDGLVMCHELTGA